MAYDERFCNPAQEMDEISRKMRAGEPDVDYAALFRKGARPHSTLSEERDPAALMIRLQSERGIGVSEASRQMRAMLDLPDPAGF